MPLMPDYDLLPVRRRRAIGLAIVYGLCGLVSAAYALSPPVEGTPRTLDTAMAVGYAMGAVLCLAVMPRAGQWAADVLLTASWLSVCLTTATRPLSGGQNAIGALLLIIALYTAYYTSGRRFLFHIVGMTALYSIVRLAHPAPGYIFFTVFTTAMIVVVSVLFHRLKSIDRRYQLLVDNGADVIVLACDGVIEWISPSVTRVLGWRPDELMGASSDRLWHASNVQSAVDIRNRAYGGETGTGLLRAVHKDGHDVWIEYNAKPKRVRGRNASIESWRDVTARVSAERELRRRERQEKESAQKAARIAEAKANLFQNLSHELRTPLAIVSGPLHDLRRHPGLSSSERANVDAAVRASARLERLVDGLLDIARGQADRLGAVPEPTDLATITRGTVQMFADMASARGLELDVRVGVLPSRTMVDPEAWITILVNLVSNSLKYTESGTVRVLVDYDEDLAHLTVTDTGVGIADADLPHVFERYEQSPARSVRGESGSGIGLALVAQLLRATGGRSAITSRVDVGTTVEIWMPAPACPAGTPTDSEHYLDVAHRQHTWAWAPPVAPVEEASSEAVVHRGRVLVVEDNADLRAYLVRLLHSDGWDVTDVADAETAAPLVCGHDLLLSDIMLPGSSGVDLVRRVRENEDDSRWMPVILLTARAEGDAIVEGLAAGADDYVTKPFSPGELLARIGTHVELSFLRQVVLDEASNRAANLERALGSNRMIGTALGIIMATEHISADEAFERLRTASQHSNRKLREVADEVIYTGAIP